MKILIISQVFWPDNVSVAQHLADIASFFSKKGHSVTVLTSQNNYENPSIKYPASETFNEVKIIRLSHSGFGKNSILSRLTDFLTFNIRLTSKLIFNRKKEFDCILGLTSPPLISFFGILAARMKSAKFVYWTMDLQPELSIQAGYIKKNSLSAKSLTFMGDYIFRKSDLIVSLDRFMSEHINERGAEKNKILTVPVWPVLDEKTEFDRNNNPFRIEHNFGDKIVIMYSGNHSVVHPLDTILETAEKLKGDQRFLFVFVGGGVRKKDVSEFKIKHDLKNIIQLPYQDRTMLPVSLGAADLHLVILGNGQVGYTHPNKIYGAMYVGKPIIYIGPEKSHITDLFDVCEGNISINAGESEALKSALEKFADSNELIENKVGSRNSDYIRNNFLPEIIMGKIESSIVKLK